MKPSMRFEDQVVLEMSRARAWDLLKDPDVVVTCLPGAEVLEIAEDGTIKGALTLSLGPSETRFAGRVNPVYDDEAYTVDMTGQGADGKGRTRASITTSVRVDELAAEQCRLAIDSSIAVSGALAAFAAAGGQAIAKRMMLDFSENLGRLGASVASAEAAGGDEGVDLAAVAAAAPTRQRLGVAGLLWRTVRDAVGRLVARFRRSPTTDTTD
jgi:uncharacterized protein